jgi:hypothetical protein
MADAENKNMTGLGLDTMTRSARIQYDTTELTRNILCCY